MIGRCVKIGDYVNTDLIYPSRYLSLHEPNEMAKHVLEGLDTHLPHIIKSAEILVAGKHLGGGSSREQAVMAIKYANVKAIVAKSFARIFYRNCINQGIYPITCNYVDRIDDGDMIEIDIDRRIVKNRTKNEIYPCEEISSHVVKIIQDGGLIPHLKKKMRKSR